MPDSPRSLNRVREIRRSDILFSVARIPNTERLIVGSSQGKVLELDASQDNPTPREMANHGRYVTAVRLAGNTVVSGGYDSRLIWWDREANRQIRSIDDAHQRWVRHIEISPDGSKLASVADDMVCRIWDVNSGRRIHELRGHQLQTPTHFSSMLYICAFSPDGRRLATGDRIGHVKIWDVAEGREIGAVEAPELYTWDGRQRIRSIGGVRCLAFSPDGNKLAVGGVGRIGNVDGLSGPSRVEVFDLTRRERLFHYTGPNGIINNLHWHPENRWLFAVGGSGNGLGMFHNPTSHAQIHRENLPMHVHDAVFNENRSRFYAVGHNRVVVMELRD